MSFRELEGETSELRLKVKTVNTFKNQLDNYKADFELSQKKHADSIAGMTTKILDLGKDFDDLSAENKELLEKNREATTKIATLESEMVFEKGNYKI